MNRADSYDALARLLDYPEDKQQLQSDYDLVSSFLKGSELTIHLPTLPPTRHRLHFRRSM